MQKWQPIETAPKNGEDFLVWFAEGHHGVGDYRPIGDSQKVFRFFYLDGDDADVLPTHWMPLPEPPES